MIRVEFLHDVVHLRLAGGNERLLVEGPSGLCGFASFYLFRMRANSVNYVDGIARTVARCENWVVAAVGWTSLADGRGPSAGEIELLKVHLRSVAPRTGLIREARANAMGTTSIVSTVADNEYRFRITAAANYLSDRARVAFASTCSVTRAAFESAVNAMRKAIFAGRPSDTDQPRPGLSKFHEATLRDVTAVGAPSNPLPHYRQEMPSLITEIRLEGLRANEPLLLKLEDISPRGRPPTLNLVDRRNDPEDTRARRPALKQAPRLFPIAEELHERLLAYVEGTRSEIAKAAAAKGKASTNFVFVSLAGRPISISAMEKLMREFRMHPDLPADLCASQCRNTFADRWFETYGASKNWELAELSGRSPDSAQFKRYANRAVGDAARRAAREVQRGLSGGSAHP